MFEDDEGHKRVLTLSPQGKPYTKRIKDKKIAQVEVQVAGSNAN